MGALNVSRGGAAVSLRRAAVAGSFYPSDPAALDAEVHALLANAERKLAVAPKAVLAPHAGYMYSGPIAASAFVELAGARPDPERVVLVGPAHYGGFRGIAAPSARAFETPLGALPVDREAIARAEASAPIVVSDRAHAGEHALEVELPFVLATFGTTPIVPLLVGAATALEVAAAIDALFGDDATRIVISSDLSHYYDASTAERLDAATARAIEALDPDAISEEQACGRLAVAGMLIAARRHGLRAVRLDLRHSGDTAGGRDEVVGYGAFAFDRFLG